MRTNVSQELTAALASRGALVAELDRLLSDADAEGRRLTPSEQARFDEVKREIEQSDTHVENLRSREVLAARSAVRVGPASSAPLAKGAGVARYVQLLLASRGVDAMAIELARRNFADMPQLVDIFRARGAGALQRAAVTPATTTDPAWAGALAAQRQLGSELIELVTPETVLGQLEGLRRVPFNVKIPRETQAIAQAKWVGQGQSKPVGKGAFDFVTVPYTKVALICLFSEELARFSDPSAEALIRSGLVRSIGQFLDEQFLSTNAPVTNVSPGGILNGLPSGQIFASSGPSWESVLFDIVSAVNKLDSGLVAARRPTWIMSRANKTAVGFLPNAFGVSAFPSVSAAGRLADIPIVVSSNMPNDRVLLVDADMLLYASDPSIALDVSREASVQADSEPATPPSGMISLWQQDLIGIRAEQFAWWGRARDQAIVEITGVGWSTAAPPGSPAEPDPIHAAAAANAASASSRTVHTRRRADE